MKEQIYVRSISTSADSSLITQYMNNSGVFYGKTDRFTANSVSCLIYRDDEPIGFLNIGDEGLSTDNILFLDILVDEKYRGKDREGGHIWYSACYKKQKAIRIFGCFFGTKRILYCNMELYTGFLSCYFSGI